MLFNVAQTKTKIPALRTMVEAIFLISLRVDSQSSGMGIRIRYMSVETFAANDVQMIGKEMAAWQESRDTVSLEYTNEAVI